LRFLIGIGLFLLGLYNLSYYISTFILNNYSRNLDALFPHDGVAVATGFALSVLVQSSSVVNSIGINMVDKKMMSLKNAFLIVIGSDIGTTMTGYIIIFSGPNISLALSSLIFAAIVTALLSKSKNVQHIALAVAGFSLLFIGLATVSEALAPFEESARALLAKHSGGFLLFVYGVLLTAVFQSSSLIMAVMITFARAGIINFEMACFVVIGMNIGTTSTGFLASLGSGQDGTAVALFLLAFNVFGGMVMAFLLLTGLINTIFSFTSLQTEVKIALFHTIFNVITSAITYCMVDKLVMLYYKQKT
jgi:phosphate:Na+ symporter